MVASAHGMICPFFHTNLLSAKNDILESPEKQTSKISSGSINSPLLHGGHKVNFSSSFLRVLSVSVVKNQFRPSGTMPRRLLPLPSWREPRCPSPSPAAGKASFRASPRLPTQ